MIHSLINEPVNHIPVYGPACFFVDTHSWCAACVSVDTHSWCAACVSVDTHSWCAACVSVDTPSWCAAGTCEAGEGVWAEAYQE